MRVLVAAVLLGSLAACSGQTTARPEDLAKYGQTSPIGTYSPSPTPTKTVLEDEVAKANFVTKANQLCAEANQQIVNLGEPTLQNLESYIGKALLITERELNQLRALPGGFTSRDPLKGMLAALDRGLKLFRAGFAQASSNPSAAAENIQQASAELQRASDLGAEFGLNACAD
jgi:hypothetical protein